MHKWILKIRTIIREMTQGKEKRKVKHNGYGGLFSLFQHVFWLI